uniref:Carboxylesterase type B domain-containing protein n=1 Tax=Phlebotomus papatasi TaxID=29031 RepID=A0A1B0DNC5_PHLPP
MLACDISVHIKWWRATSTSQPTGDDTVARGLPFASIMRSFAGVAFVVILVLFLHPEKICVSGEDEKTIVKTNLGEIEGVKLKSRLGKSYHSFRGIRYAKSPTDRLRFQAPEPVDPWTGAYDATKDGPQCPQPSFNGAIVESEDCLRLNIYTKEVPKNGSFPNNNLKPVLFYIHPGGFYAFSGISAMFGPEFFMDRDVVLVTINYRLGSLGYLSTGTKDSPGNAGYKDQVMALKFIRDHVSAFGGDPNSITLFGYNVLTNDTLKYDFDKRFSEVAPICFLYERDTERSKKISQTLRKKYLFSDSAIGFSVHRFVQLASRHTKVFYYKNTFRGRYSFFNYPENKPYVAPTFAHDDPEILNVERMTRMWTTFADRGNPNNPNDEYLRNLKWTPYSSLLDNYLEIGNADNFTMREGLYTERFRIWDELFPLPLTNKTNHL